MLLNLFNGMKTTYIIGLFLLVFQTVFSQSEKIIQGSVINKDFSVFNIDVINQTTSKITSTNFDGKFSILAKVGDVLIFGGKNYVTTKIFLKKEDFEKGILKVFLNQEIIALAEVEVTKTVDDLKIEAPIVAPLRSVDNLLNSPTNTMVYNGSIQDGLNFVAIGKLIGKLFKGKSEDKKEINKIEIKEYIAANFNKDFFLKTLQLKEDKIALFLEFCYADPQAEISAQNNNILQVTDFLLSKKEAFLKLKD